MRRAMGIQITKTCKDCGTTKPQSHFYRARAIFPELGGHFAEKP